MGETTTLPPQHQDHQPGRQNELTPQPQTESKTPGSGRLKDRVILVPGGDSGISRAVAVLAAKEGADVAIAYLEEDDDASETQRLVQNKGPQCELVVGDIGHERTARDFVKKTIDRFGRLDVLVDGAAEQYPQERPEDISAQQLERTFRTNVFSQFFTVQER
jgi:NAD(P)-dependent dehydrogenase (short-subunit alcohol dehydrogenase family)